MWISILKWWLVAEILGLVALPITRRVFAWLPDGGYGLSKVVGLLVSAYLLWLGASGGLIQNDLGGCSLAVALTAALSLGLVWRSKSPTRWTDEVSFWRARRGHILRVELLFLLSFVGWALMRAYAPSKIVYAYGEKYMEFAFLNGILRSPTFPPLDPWLAGYAISYYYFGYVMMAFVTRLAGTIPGISFDLYDALLFALAAGAAYELAASLVRAARGSRRAAAWTGLLGATFTVFMGNLDGVLMGLYSARLLPQSLVAWLAVPELANYPQTGSFYPGHSYYQWWWWSGSRLIGDISLSGQPVGASPISEFPAFSFLLGDNHPHKLALPFVILAIGLAFNLLLRQIGPARRLLVRNPRQRSRPAVPAWLHGQKFVRIALAGNPAPTLPGITHPEESGSWGQQTRTLLGQFRAGWREAGLGRWLFYALALGGLGFLNTWDFPIYLGLTVLAYAAGNYWAHGRITRADLLRALGVAAGLGAVSIGLYLLFYLGFASQAGGILPYVAPPTRLAQFGLIFGPFLFVASFFLGGVLVAAARAHGWRFTHGLRQLGQVWLWLTGLSYGPYLLIVVVGLAVLSTGRLDTDTLQQVQNWLGGMTPVAAFASLLAQRLSDPWMYLALSLPIAAGLAGILWGVRPAQDVAPGHRGVRLPPPVLFATLLAVWGLLLPLVLEFFFLRDSFGVRMNSVFKFYFQAWVMLAIACAFGVWWFLRRAPVSRLARAILGGGAGLLTAAGLVYTGMAIITRDHAFEFPPHLDATATLAGDYPDHWGASPDDWAAIQWLNANVSGAPTILEAPAGGYNPRGRISAFTGLPTLQGWSGHEYQWRGSGEAYEVRTPDVQAIFTTPDASQMLDLLHKYQVRFVIIGQLENQYISDTCATQCSPRAAQTKFGQALEPVFTEGGTTVYLVPQEGP